MSQVHMALENLESQPVPNRRHIRDSVIGLIRPDWTNDRASSTTLDGAAGNNSICGDEFKNR